MNLSRHGDGTLLPTPAGVRVLLPILFTELDSRRDPSVDVSLGEVTLEGRPVPRGALRIYRFVDPHALRTDRRLRERALLRRRPIALRPEGSGRDENPLWLVFELRLPPGEPVRGRAVVPILLRFPRGAEVPFEAVLELDAGSREARVRSLRRTTSPRRILVNFALLMAVFLVLVAVNGFANAQVHAPHPRVRQAAAFLLGGALSFFAFSGDQLRSYFAALRHLHAFVDLPEAHLHRSTVRFLQGRGTSAALATAVVAGMLAALALSPVSADPAGVGGVVVADRARDGATLGGARLYYADLAPWRAAAASPRFALQCGDAPRRRSAEPLLLGHLAPGVLAAEPRWHVFRLVFPRSANGEGGEAPDSVRVRGDSLLAWRFASERATRALRGRVCGEAADSGTYLVEVTPPSGPGEPTVIRLATEREMDLRALNVWGEERSSDLERRVNPPGAPARDPREVWRRGEALVDSLERELAARDRVIRPASLERFLSAARMDRPSLEVSLQHNDRAVGPMVEAFVNRAAVRVFARRARDLPPDAIDPVLERFRDRVGSVPPQRAHVFALRGHWEWLLELEERFRPPRPGRFHEAVVGAEPEGWARWPPEYALQYLRALVKTGVVGAPGDAEAVLARRPFFEDRAAAVARLVGPGDGALPGYLFGVDEGIRGRYGDAAGREALRDLLLRLGLRP